MNHVATLDDVLEAVNAGFTQMQGQIQGLDGRVQGLETKMGRLEGRMDGLDRRMGILEQRVDGLDRKVGSLDQKVQVLDQKIDKLGRKVDDIHGELKGDMVVLMEHMGGFVARQLKFETTLASERAARKRLEAKLL